MKQGTCCLLIEDDPEDQEVFMDAIHHLSSTTRCYPASNGEEALLTLFQADFTPDIIVTDLNMPKMDGLEFLRNLRSIERFRQIPVIMFSSYFSDQQIQSVKNLGVLAYYSKTRMGMLKDILRKHFPDADRMRTVL